MTRINSVFICLVALLCAASARAEVTVLARATVIDGSGRARTERHDYRHGERTHP